MDLFDIIGPVMIGPSSSHTAGVVRIGNVVNKILDGAPYSAHIKFHGSLAATYRGHGSDKAIVAGLLGFSTDDERIVDSFKHAEDAGMYFDFETIDLKNAHPNTVLIEARKNTDLTLIGESVGGGNILIKKIDNINVSFDGFYDTLIVSHIDTPGTISQVTDLLAKEQINIANMSVYRARKGGDAIMIIEADQKLNRRLSKVIEILPNILGVTLIAGLR